jgi:hypothetical protein
MTASQDNVVNIRIYNNIITVLSTTIIELKSFKTFLKL